MKNEVAVRKRSQIAKANRTMFLWIACASALVGAAAVVGVFLFQQLMYNEKVLAEKQKTATTLTENNSVVADLADEIRVLDTDPNLAMVKANPDDQALQVILDALPSEANALALGSSLQLKLLAGINGLDPIETLSVSPVTTSDEEVVEDAAAPEDSGVVAVEEEGTTGGPLSPNVIDFSFSVIGTQDAIKELLLRFEHSIRTIDLVTVSFETQQDGRFLVTVTARAYYEPERIVELTDKAVPR